jgi:hypothetical protein
MGNVLGALLFLSESVAISRGVHSEDHVEITGQFASRSLRERSQISQQLLVSRHGKRHLRLLGRREQVLALHPGSFDQAVGEISSVSRFHLSAAAFETRNEIDDIHAGATPEF